MYREAAQAPDAVRAQLHSNGARVARLAQRLRASPPRAVVTCARGSSDHAATYASYLIETRLGVLTASAAPSVSSVYDGAPDLRGRRVARHLAVGRAAPTCWRPSAAPRSAGARIVALVNAETSPLAQLADDLIPLRAGPERSVAATKSYIASLAAIVQLVAEWTRRCRARGGAARGARAARARLGARLERGRDAASPRPSNLYVIGRGLGLGVAQEAALKFKETCGLHAEALSAAELRHGPMALVRAGFPLLLFAQNDETRAGVDRARRRARGARRAGAAGRRRRPPARIALPTRRRAPGDRAAAVRAELLPHGQRAVAGARPRSGPPAAPEQGDRDPLMALALVNGRVLQPMRASSTGRVRAASSRRRIVARRCRRTIRAAAPPQRLRPRRRAAAAGIHRLAGERRRRRAVQRRAERRVDPRHRRRAPPLRHHRLPADADQRRPGHRGARHRRGARRASRRACPACSASTSRGRSSTWRARACTIRPSCASSTRAALGLLTSLRGGRTLVTLAPEMTTPQMIEQLVTAGVVVSAGHTNATYAEMQRGARSRADRLHAPLQRHVAAHRARAGRGRRGAR